jgi:hypothetical protein
LPLGVGYQQDYERDLDDPTGLVGRILVIADGHQPSTGGRFPWVARRHTNI